MEWLSTGTIYSLLAWGARLWLLGALLFAVYEGFLLAYTVRKGTSKKSEIISIFHDSGGKNTTNRRGRTA